MSKTAAYNELEELLEANGYTAKHLVQRLVVVPDGLWYRLRMETRDPFGSAAEGDDRVAVWYRGSTMVLPESRCVNLCFEEEEIQ